MSPTYIEGLFFEKLTKKVELINFYNFSLDDFLAEGNAAIGLLDLIRQGNANVVGVTAAIEKYFQGGHKMIEKMGIPVYCPAFIKEFKDNKPVF